MRVAVTITAAVWIALGLGPLVAIPSTLSMGKPWVALGELAVAALALISAIGLLANRTWAIPPLVALCVGAVVQIAFLTQKITQALRAPDGPPPDEARLWTMGAVIGSVAMSLPFVAMGLFLSWRKTRLHFKSARSRPFGEERRLTTRCS